MRATRILRCRAGALDCARSAAVDTSEACAARQTAVTGCVEPDGDAVVDVLFDILPEPHVSEHEAGDGYRTPPIHDTAEVQDQIPSCRCGPAVNVVCV